MPSLLRLLCDGGAVTDDVRLGRAYPVIDVRGSLLPLLPAAGFPLVGPRDDEEAVVSPLTRRGRLVPSRLRGR